MCTHTCTHKEEGRKERREGGRNGQRKGREEDKERGREGETGRQEGRQADRQASRQANLRKQRCISRFWQEQTGWLFFLLGQPHHTLLFIQPLMGVTFLFLLDYSTSNLLQDWPLFVFHNGTVDLYQRNAQENSGELSSCTQEAESILTPKVP